MMKLRLGGGSVLVVDDEPTNRLVMTSLVRKLGLPVLCVDDGEKAVEAVRRGEAVCLIFMDIQMPVIDGFEATKIIRRLQNELGQPRVPIVALTGSIFGEDRERCLGAGMDDLLAKPARVKDVEEVLARWLGTEP